MDEITAETAEDTAEMLIIMIRQPITHSYQLEEAEATKVGAVVKMIERLELIVEEVDGEEDIEGARDSNFDGGRSPAMEDNPNDSNSSSRINGQIVKNGAASAGSGSETASRGEDSGMSSLSSADGHKSGTSAIANDSKVIKCADNFCCQSP